jgi:TadE-like protein
MKHPEGRRGSAFIEAAMLMPVILLLLTGMVSLARVTYTYYTLRKTVYSIARYVGTQQGVNFCDANDPAITAAINFGLTGTTDGSQPVFVTGLTAAMFQIAPEQYDPVAQTLSACGCGVPGCDLSQGGTAPDFIVVSMPDGYQEPVRILGFNLDPILLKPQVKVPYGGT